MDIIAPIVPMNTKNNSKYFATVLDFYFVWKTQKQYEF